MEQKEFTSEEKEKIAEDIKEQFLRIVLNDARGMASLDKQAATEAIHAIYEKLYPEYGKPPVEFALSPRKARERAMEIADDPNEVVFSGYGNVGDIGWVSNYVYKRAIGEMNEELFDDFEKLIKANVFDMIQFDERIIMVPYPIFLKYDDQYRLHCEDGAAIGWEDGSMFYADHGVKIPEKYFKEIITAKMIDEEDNAEVRRVALKRMGFDNYVKEAEFEEVARDEWGVLYRRERENDVPLAFVSVLNSSPEEEGVSEEGLVARMNPEDFRPSELFRPGYYKRYSIRCHHESETPLEALAASVGLTSEEYAQVEIET